MSIKEMSKEDLELYSHKDLTYMLIKECGAMNTADLFKKITTSLELSNSFYENKIGDYYTTLTTDKRFILLEDGNWDLSEKYASSKTNKKITSLDTEEDDEDDDELDQTREKEDDEDTDEIDYDQENDDEDFDDSDDDLKDLVVIDEDEMELED